MNTDAFSRARASAESYGLRIVDEDLNRPWGGFLCLDDTQIAEFAEAYFPGELDRLDASANGERLPMSPKLLIVAPGKRLSWQYHFRRGELWSVLEGPVAVASGPDDEQPAPRTVTSGERVRLEPGTRHRLIGADGWGIVAEIWQHTDATAPSDEADIVRLQDDYGR